MSQNHSGSGDNVGRDKNEQTTNDFSGANLGGGFAGRDNYGDVNNTNHNTQNFYYNQPQEKRDENQRLLIKYSKDTATRLLSQSLRNQVYITLNKQVDETKVIPAIQLKRVNQQIESLPSGTSIINVYDRTEDIQGRLLILGNPGAGKSTALYKLAETLAKRAEKDINHPIPLLFNLSSWTSNYTTIKDWLIDELNVQHGFSKKLAIEYLEKELIIPLLDGLDELRSDRQVAYVEAINDFLLPRTWKNPLVVCSRLEEFELLNTRICLNGSVILESLSDEQINQYLQQTNALTIQQLIQNDQDWQELAQTPLFLDIMVLANDKISLNLISQVDKKQKIFYLMEIYLQDRLEDVGYWQSIYQNKIKNSPERRQQSLKSYLQYVQKPQQSRHYLQWLAKQLDRNNQTIFLIEKLQPTDLANNKQRSIYELIYWLIFCQLLFSIGSISIVPKINFYVIGGIITLTIGLIFCERNNSIVPIEKLSLSVSLINIKYKNKPIITIIGSLILAFGSSVGNLIFVILIPLILQSILFLKGLKIAKKELSIKTLSNQGIIYSSQIMLFAIVFVNILSQLPLNFFIWLETLNKFNTGLLLLLVIIFISLFILICSSIISFLLLKIIVLSCQIVSKHFSLRLVLTFNNYTPWNYARFLDYCTEQLLLQRVGGGYRFIHRLLQEHLMNLE